MGISLNQMVSSDFKEMVLDYMNSGFLDNIIDMLKSDTTLFALIPHMLKDERLRVRIGAIALIEELHKDLQTPLKAIIKDIASLLSDSNPTIRGDALTALGYIHDAEALSYIRHALSDSNQTVRELAVEILKETQMRVS